jgi:hypothetical protein
MLSPDDFYGINKILDLKEDPLATTLPDMPNEIRQKIEEFSRVGEADTSPNLDWFIAD